MRLGSLIAAWRAANRYGTRELAKQIGISAATLSRIENGRNCDATSVGKLLIWLMAQEEP